MAQSAKIKNIQACPGKGEARDGEIGQCARGSNFLRDANLEEVDDVEEELEQEVQDGEELGSLVTGASRGVYLSSKPNFQLSHFLA